MEMRCAFVNCEIITPPPVTYIRGPEPELIYIDDGVIICGEDGKIEQVKRFKELDVTELDSCELILDCEGKAVIPGFVDPHTHLIYAGSRIHEFIMRLKGKTYLEIAESGGGIAYTVKLTSEASETELLNLATERARQMISGGVVGLEVKTGYHIEPAGELLELDVILKLGERLPIPVSPTLLMHLPPKDRGQDEYVEEFIERALYPAKTKAKFVDVFCDIGAFDLNSATKLLREAKASGYQLKAHLNEFRSLGGIEVAVSLGARSVDHLIRLSEEEVKILAESETTAVLMPATSFFINEMFAPARALLNSGAIVALATDHNAGSSQTLSMSFVINLAVSQMRMLPEEALVASTLNAAYAAGLEGRLGAIQAGYDASFIVLNTSDWRELSFSPGNDIIKHVIVGGRVFR